MAVLKNENKWWYHEKWPGKAQGLSLHAHGTWYIEQKLKKKGPKSY
jgi:hypothetical protein